MARKTLNRKTKRPKSKKFRSKKSRKIRGGGRGMYDVGSSCSPDSTVQKKNTAFPSGSRPVKCCNGRWTPYNGLNAGC